MFVMFYNSCYRMMSYLYELYKTLRAFNMFNFLILLVKIL